MNILGWILAVCGTAGLIFGLRMMLKGKKMGTVPFRKALGARDPGGAARQTRREWSRPRGKRCCSPQPLIAPMSGQPCIGYEITVERKWEKHVTTEKGHEKRTGSSKVHGEYRGSFFQIGDAQGAVLVDATSEPDSEYEKSHTSTVTVGMMIPGTLTFGQMQMGTPTILDHDSRTVAFVGTEKILKPSQTIYALGQMAQGPQGLAIGTPKGIGTGKLIMHHEGRERLVGKTKRNMILGYAIGGVLFVCGVPLGLFGPKAHAAPIASAPGSGLMDECPTSSRGRPSSCEDRMYSAEGKNYEWKVTEAATYTLDLKQPAVANPIDGVLEVFDSAGKRVAAATTAARPKRTPTSASPCNRGRTKSTCATSPATRSRGATATSGRTPNRRPRPPPWRSSPAATGNPVHTTSATEHAAPSKPGPSGKATAKHGSK